MVYSDAETMLCENVLKASMNPLNSELELLKLRSQLEEILTMVKADLIGAAFNRSVDEEAELSAQHQNDATAVDPDIALADYHQEEDTACEPVLTEVGQRDEPDDVYDNALVVVTEFGQASPAMLQMWLSIDYSRAITILDRLQADGLISAKGKVRHKAFLLRRSLEQQA